MPAHSKTSNYRVEVSGWDSSEAFFVEKTPLTWHRDAEKQITLKSHLRVGCVLFVRLIQPVLPNTVPVAYQVTRVEPVDEQSASGLHLVSLVQLRSRSTERTAELPPEHAKSLGPRAA